MGKSVSLYNKECVIAAINNDIGIEIMATSKEFIDYVVAFPLLEWWKPNVCLESMGSI